MARPKRAVYFMPDMPGMEPRMRDALQVAKDLAGARGGEPGQKIPVFGLRNPLGRAGAQAVKITEDTHTRTGQLEVPEGVRIIDVGDKNVRKVFDAAVLCSCIIRHNACYWSQKHQDNQLVPEFMAELAKTGARAAGGKPSLSYLPQVCQENLQAGYDMNLEMMNNAGPSLFGKGWPSVQRRIESECRQNLQSTKVNDGLIGLIKTEILAPLARVMQNIVQKKLPAMERSLTGMAESMPKWDTKAPQKRGWLMKTVNDMNESMRAIEDFGGLGEAESNPILLNRSASAISKSMSALNSISYAYAVAGSDFGEGVMNVPWDGEATEGMLNTLIATGIGVRGEEQAPAAEPDLNAQVPGFRPPCISKHA